MSFVKGLVTELTSPYVQSVWGFRGKMVRDTGSAACCNYFSKKKKKNLVEFKNMFKGFLLNKKNIYSTN